MEKNNIWLRLRKDITTLHMVRVGLPPASLAFDSAITQASVPRIRILGLRHVSASLVFANGTASTQ